MRGLFFALLAATACSSDAETPTERPTDLSSPAAHLSAQPSAMRTFQLGRGSGVVTWPGEQGAIDRLEARGSWVAPRLHSSKPSAHVLLPRLLQRGPLRLSDLESGLTMEATLMNASDSGEPVTLVDGFALFKNAAPGGGDVLHRVLPDGVEDLVVFEQRPDRQALTYAVDVGNAAGLRLVDGTLELLDAGGAPRLRMTAPLAVSHAGEAIGLEVFVLDCAYDASPRPPWGRAVTPPGNSSCQVEVSWSAEAEDYPLLVDPTWTSTSNLVSARENHTAVLLPGSSLILLSGGGFGSDSAELYDTNTGTSAATAAPLAMRTYHTATLLPSGKVLFVGGDTGGTTEIYDLQIGSFAAGPNLPEPRNGHRATLLPSGKVLITGGCNVGDSNCFQDGDGYLATALVYDESTGNLTPTGDMASPRAQHIAASVSGLVPSGGDVLVAGGCFDMNCSTILNTAEIYSEADGTFRATGSMQDPRREHRAATLHDGRVLIQGSYESETAELYDPATEQFQLAGAPAELRLDEMTLTTLTNGDVLRVGGEQATGIFPTVKRSASLYSAANNSYRLLDVPPPFAAYGHSATPLPNGGVLIAGGRDSISNFTGSRHTAIASPLELGQPCVGPGDCTSGFCADGLCCNFPCQDQCEACNEPGTSGTCVAILGTPRGERPACPTGSDDPCQAAGCDGQLRTSCAGFAGTDTVCVEPSCADGVEAPQSFCDGAGSCNAQPARDCGSYTCGATACLTECGSAQDCAPGNQCQNAICVTGASCSSDNTAVIDVSGDAQSCAPYLCRGGFCIERCASTSDCSAGNVCNADTGICGASSGNTKSSDGGCGCTTAGAVTVTSARSAPTRGSWPLLFLVALAAMTRRRSRRG